MFSLKSLIFADHQYFAPMASFLRWLPPAYFAQYKNPNDNTCVHRDLPGITVFPSFLTTPMQSAIWLSH